MRIFQGARLLPQLGTTSQGHFGSQRYTVTPEAAADVRFPFEGRCGPTGRLSFDSSLPYLRCQSVEERGEP